MKALIWKEWHENFKWAMLPVLLLGGFLLVIGPPPLMNYGVLIICGLIAAVFSAVLGVLQVLPESHGDKRSLLLHRPLRPSQIFLGKATAGLVLCLLAPAIPFACAVVWVATPGNVAAPFRWPMALPWLADILTGVVYYFAGMLTAQREARWYGSRSLGLAAALFCTFLVWVLPEFWQALLAIAIMGVLVGLAAWGSFLTGGAYASQPRLTRIALATTCLVGLLVLGVTAKCTIGGCVWARYMHKYAYALDREGRVLVLHWGPGDTQSVTGPDGQEPEALKGKQLDSSAIREVGAPISASAWPKFLSYRSPGRFSVRCRNESSSGDERWFYVPDEGHLLGYDGRSRRLIGSCGPDGFVQAGQQPKERFQGELYDSSFLYEDDPVFYLAFPGGVYTPDFARHTIHTLFAPSDGQTVVAVIRWKDEKQKVSRAFVLTDQSVHVLDESGVPLFSAPLAYDRGTHGLVRVGRLENPQRWVVWYEPSWYLRPDAGKTMPSYLVEYDVGGRELARRTLPPCPLAEAPYGQALFGLATPPAEAAVIAAATRYSIAAAGRNEGREIQPIFHFLVVPTQFFIPGSGAELASVGGAILAYRALILSSALACAAICYLLARRHSFSRDGRVGWGLCGLLFGPAGLLLMLAVQQWPARVICPACRRPRVVTRDTCEHCGAPHALPIQDGTEIFEPEVATPHLAVSGR
jgi:hypothetical protein